MIEQNTGLGKRRPPCAYQITPELQLRVAMWPSATGQDDLYRISAYACGIGSIAPCETDGNLHQAPRKNCVIPGSRHFKASIALDRTFGFAGRASPDGRGRHGERWCRAER